jgi:uncharacterized lipoprotein YehR (DUF1307 family)
MKKTNKIITLLLSMVFILSLTACGKDDPFTDSKGNSFLGIFATCDDEGNVEFRDDGTTYDYSITINEDGTFVFDYSTERQFSGTWTKSEDGDSITLSGNTDSAYSKYGLYCHFDEDGTLLIDATENMDNWETDVMVRQEQ